MPDVNFHILLADDDEDDVMLFKDAIREIDIPVQLSHARDGHKALLLLKESKPDAIFLDINMPNINGIECLKLIRANKNYDFLPVIIYSTSDSNTYIDRCFKEGANRYIVKPYTYTGIIRLLKNFLPSMPDISRRPQKKEFVVVSN